MIEKNEISGVYRIRCIENKMAYIGSSKNISKRLKAHRYYLINKMHATPRLQKDFSLYGEASFESEILELVNKDTLLERELYHITKHSSNNINHGYNVQTPKGRSSNNGKIQVMNIKVDYGDCVFKLDLSGNFIEKFKSFKHAGEATGDSNIGKVLRGERKHSRGFIWVYEKDYKNGNYEVFKKKKYVFKEGKSPVCQFTEDGEFIQAWDSIKDASDEICGKSKKAINNSISALCSGKGKTAYGYKWKYLKDCEGLPQSFMND